MSGSASDGAAPVGAGGGSLRVLHPADLRPDAASGAMLRAAAISAGTVGAQGLWVGWVELAPGAASAVHHHGVAESAIFVVAGRARFWAGPALQERHDAEAGDFVWVPPGVLHVEANRSATDPVHMVVARSTQEAIVVNVEAPPGWRPALD